MKMLTTFLAFSMTACGTNLPMDLSKMSPEQLKAVKESSVTAQCTVLNGPWGKGQTTHATFDKAAVASGSVTIDSECKISVTADPKPPK